MASELELPKLPQDSILEIDGSSWIVGDTLLLSLDPVAPSMSVCCWRDGSGSFFSLSEIPTNINGDDDNNNSPQPPRQQQQTRPLSPTGPVRLVHSAGSCNFAWQVGDSAFIKIQGCRHLNATREHVTLDYYIHSAAAAAEAGGGFSFTDRIPKVLYHYERGGEEEEGDGGARYCLVTTRVPGQILDKAWPGMNGAEKESCVWQAVGICKELARREGDRICSLDGGEMRENWLVPGTDGANEKDFSHEELRAFCEEIGMDCTGRFVLHHCDLGPTNVLVDLMSEEDGGGESGGRGCRVGVIDWDMTGFVPREWIRTKFRVCCAMDFDYPGHRDPGSSEMRVEWRRRMQVALGQEGFKDVADAWTRRRGRKD